MRTAVVISGLPGSGKTTLATGLSAELGLPRLDKDEIMEALFSEEPVRTEQDRRVLSRRADLELQAEALAHEQIILSSWWRHPSANNESGTPVEWLFAHAERVVEVFCSCPAEIAAERFYRRVRHPGHLDLLRSPVALLEQLQQAAERGPLFPGAVVCNTSGPSPYPGVSELANRVARLLGTSEA